MSMKLYLNPLSPHARRCVMGLSELGLESQTQIVDFAKGEHKAPEYMQHNPNGKVPVLEDNGFWLWESNAILCYLAEKAPGKNMYGTDARARADVNRWLFWESAHWGNSCSVLVGERVIKPMMHKQEPDAAVVAHAEANFTRFGAVLNGQLEGKQWVMGNTFTIADLALAAPLMYAQPAQFNWQGFKHMQAWFERMSQRDSWKKTNPTM
jgi:glutathione S-transferase